nr:HNH endonuclease [Glaciibacter superstes]
MLTIKPTEAVVTLILDVGRSRGLGDDLLPDFLGFGDQRLQIVYEADRVTDDDLRESIDESLRTLSGREDLDIRATERALIGTARVGQQQFARKVLANAAFSCVFCGLSTRASGLPSARMLIASHVKPWKQSSARERLDTQNGLAACPTHDAAFEAFFFSVNERGRVVRSAPLMRAIESDAGMRRNFDAPGLSGRLLLPEAGVAPGLSYTSWHLDQLVM